MTTLQIDFLKRFDDVIMFNVYFTDQNLKNYKNSDFDGFWAITFSQNMIMKKTYFCCVLQVKEMGNKTLEDTNFFGPNF